MATDNPYRTPFFYGPEGRLIQVDAALEAVRRGSTTVGIKTNDYVLLASQVRPARPLMQAPEKVFAIDEHVGASGSGYVGDLLHLIDEARVQAQRYRLVYDTPIDIISLAKHLGNYFHSFTLYAVRPPGASVILAGADQQGVQLYQIEPGGSYFNGKAATIGQSSETALEIIAKNYSENLSLDDGIELATKAITEAAGEKVSIDLGVVRKSVGKFEKVQHGIPAS
jgi:proteasome alpha subunit